MQYKHDWHHPNLHGIAQQLSKFGTNQPHQCNVPRSGQYWPLETPFWTRDMIWLVYESVEYFFSIQSTLSDGNRHMPIFQKRMSEIWRQKAHGGPKRRTKMLKCLQKNPVPFFVYARISKRARTYLPAPSKILCVSITNLVPTTTLRCGGNKTGNKKGQQAYIWFFVVLDLGFLLKCKKTELIM